MQFARRRSERDGREDWKMSTSPHPVDLSEARRIAFAEIEGGWQDGWGELMIDSDRTYENDDVYTFDYGAREYLIDGDFRYALAGYRIPVVRKADGAVSRHLPGPPRISDFDEKFPNLRLVDSEHRDGDPHG